MTTLPRATFMSLLVQPIRELTRNIFARGRRGSEAPHTPVKCQQSAAVDLSLTGEEWDNISNPDGALHSHPLGLAKTRSLQLQDEPSPLPTALMESTATNTTPIISDAEPRVEPDTAAITRLIQKQHVKFSKRSSRVRDERRQAHYKRSELKESFRFLKESFQPISDALNAGPETPEQTGFAELAQTLLDDLKRVEDHMASVNEAESSVITWEEKLADPESQIMKHLETLVSLIPGADLGGELDAFNIDEDTDDAVAIDGHSETPSLVRQYYARAGEAGYLQERLTNAIHAHHEEVAERQLLQDQEGTPEPPDEIFEREFNDRVSKLRDDIRDAEEATERLAGECRERGLKIVERSRAPFVQDAKLDDGEDRGSSLGGHHDPDDYTSPYNGNAVERWMEKVEATGDNDE